MPLNVGDVIFCVLYALFVGSPIFANAEWITSEKRILLMLFYFVASLGLLFLWKKYL